MIIILLDCLGCVLMFFSKLMVRVDIVSLELVGLLVICFSIKVKIFNIRYKLYKMLFYGFRNCF